MSATIAVIARQNQQENTLNFLHKHQGVLYRYCLVTPEEIGKRIQAETDLSVEFLLPSSQGGDTQLTSLVANGEITAVICLLGTDYTQFQDPDIQVLQRICVVKNVPIAINLATAEIIIDRLRRNRIAHLIFNPVAGQGNADEDLATIKRLLQPAMELIVHLTTTEISPQKLAQDAIESEADLIIASGGDGTVSSVSGALIGTNIPLGIIPRGTANAFAKALGIPFGFNPIQSACEVIIEGNTHTVDISRCNGLPMILLAGLGLEAEAIERADREAKDRWGVFAYIMAGIQQLKEQELFTTEIEVEGVVKQFHAAAVTIANAAPPTSVMAQGFGSVNVKDGLLDVTIAAPKTDLEAVTAMASLLGAALFKTPTNRDDIINLKTKKIKVKTAPPQKVVLDGEMIGTTPIEVECIPSGLNVLAPLVR